MALADGLPGVGKTTQEEKWYEEEEVVLFKEPHRENPYRGTEDVVSARHWFLERLAGDFVVALYLVSNGHDVALDRSFHSTLAFASLAYRNGRFSPSEFNTFSFLWKQSVQALPPPDLVVYFDCKPETALKRMQGRGRDEEKGLPLSFQEKLGEEQAALYSSLARNNGWPLVVLDWDPPFRTVKFEDLRNY